MTPEEQKQLVRQLCDNIAKHIVGAIEAGKIPESWDGFEIRQYVADQVVWRKMTPKRRREYNNTILINNL